MSSKPQKCLQLRKCFKYPPLTYDHRWLNSAVYLKFFFCLQTIAQRTLYSHQVHRIHIINLKLYRKYHLNNQLCFKYAVLSDIYMMAGKLDFHHHHHSAWAIFYALLFFGMAQGLRRIAHYKPHLSFVMVRARSSLQFPLVSVDHVRPCNFHMS